MSKCQTFPPTLTELEAIARSVLVAIPDPLRRHLEGVVLRVEDFPDRRTELEMELNSPFDLLGLYRGVSLDQKSVSQVTDDVDMIFLYRRPILDFWCEGQEDLAHIVRHVLIHEVGHHFGFSDADMARIEAEM